jgi:excisionase family DNA binding protein
LCDVREGGGGPMSTAGTNGTPRSPRAAIPRLALTVADAAAALGVSEDYFRENIAAELQFVRRGRKKLVAVRELERWLEENASVVMGGVE